MHKKLVQYDQWHFVEVDPVRLQRTAQVLRDQILSKVRADADKYGFYSRTLPIIDAAIRGEITKSLDEDEIAFISSNFTHDKREGFLPLEFDREFTRAVADFSVTVQGVSLEQTEKITENGITYGWVEFEDEGDWPEKVPYP